MTPYETLGIQPVADIITIERAYKSKARELHPDRGGSEEAFRDVQRAYDVLRDPAKRQEYDRTGKMPDDAHDDTEAEVHGMVVRAFGAAIAGLLEAGASPKYKDVRELMVQSLNNGRGEQEKALASMLKIEAALLECVGRFSIAVPLVGQPSEENIMQAIVANQVKCIRNDLAGAHKRAELFKRAVELVKRFKFEHYAAKAGFMASASSTFTMRGTWTPMGGM